MNYDKNFSLWYFCSWNLQINSLGNILNLKCFAQSSSTYSISIIWLFNLYFQTLLVNIIEILPVITFDVGLITFGKFAFFIPREKSKLNWESGNNMSGLNSEEPPVKYIVQALRIWKLGWFSPVEAKTVPGERILVTMMINNK